MTQLNIHIESDDKPARPDGSGVHTPSVVPNIHGEGSGWISFQAGAARVVIHGSHSQLNAVVRAVADAFNDYQMKGLDREAETA